MENPMEILIEVPHAQLTQERWEQLVKEIDDFLDDFLDTEEIRAIDISWDIWKD